MSTKQTESSAPLHAVVMQRQKFLRGLENLHSHCVGQMDLYPPESPGQTKWCYIAEGVRQSLREIENLTTCDEWDQIDDPAGAQDAELRKHFESFAGFAASCRRENTYEWMCLMLDWLNGVASRLDPEAYFEIVGADHFEMHRVPKSA